MPGRMLRVPLAAAGPTFDVAHADAEFIDPVSGHDSNLMTRGMVPVPEPANWMMVLGLAALVARRARA